MRAVYGLLLLTACTSEAVQFPLAGTGVSSVLLFAQGGFAVDRDDSNASVPAIPLDQIEAGKVFALDYAVPLANLAIPGGALVEDPAGGPLPRPSAVRQLRYVDGEASWASVDRDAVDVSRGFREIARPPDACVGLSLTLIDTSTLAGEPRSAHPAGSQHVWLNIVGQPLRAVDLVTGAITAVELDGDSSGVTASTSNFGNDFVWTVRVRGGHPQLDQWRLDVARLGQVEPVPVSSTTLPDGDYRWMADRQIQDQAEVDLLAREGIWLHHDDRGTTELARWTSNLGEPAYGAMVRNGKTVAAVLSDSSRIRWRFEGETEIREKPNGEDPMVSAGYALGGDLMVGISNGGLWWLHDEEEWIQIGNRSFVEPVRAIVPVHGGQFVTGGLRGSVAAWRLNGGWCDPLVVPGGPDIFAIEGLTLRQLLVAHQMDGAVKLYWLTIEPR